MEHSHDHHNHSIELKDVNNAFIIGIILNFLFVVIESAVGFYTHSLALLTDAGHNLSDVAALSLSLFAFRLVKVKPNDRFTYGLKKTTVLVTLLNSLILILVIGGIAYEAIMRIFNPQPIEGKTMALVALIGIFINAFTAYLFLKNKEHDLNVKAAYLHLFSDALVSVGVVIGGFLIYFTNWYWLDSVISLIIVGIIVGGTWGLLKDSLQLSLDAVPKNVDLEKVKSVSNNIKGIENIHHIHVWAMSTTETALTAHLVISETNNDRVEDIKNELRHELMHLNIQHITLETEQKVCAKDECKN